MTVQPTCSGSSHRVASLVPVVDARAQRAARLRP